MFMCPRHWYSLPPAMRDAIWATYRRGQERHQGPELRLPASRQRRSELARRQGGHVMSWGKCRNCKATEPGVRDGLCRLCRALMPP